MSADAMLGVTVADSITTLPPDARGTVVVAASHGGRYAAVLAARFGVRAVVFSDAGFGLEEAGVAGLDLLDELGVPAAAISHETALIGSGRDLWQNGEVSRANGAARRLGAAAGQSCRACAARLLAAPPRGPSEVAPPTEARSLLDDRAPRVWLLDSAALVGPGDAGDVVVTGSHGALLGERPESAVKAEVAAAFFNDAGGRATTRLGALDARGIAAATVAAATARIGDGRSTYEDGIISACNAAARRAGVVDGIRAKEAIGALRRHLGEVRAA